MVEQGRLKMINLDVDVAVIGAGPAGLAAAVSARENGAKDVIVLDRNNNSIKQFPKNTRLAIFRYIYEILTKNESISYLDIFNKIEKNLKRIDGIPKSELLELKKKFNDLKYRETLRQYFQEMAKVIVKLRELDANYSKIEIQDLAVLWVIPLSLPRAERFNNCPVRPAHNWRNL